MDNRPHTSPSGGGPDVRDLRGLGSRIRAGYSPSARTSHGKSSGQSTTGQYPGSQLSKQTNLASSGYNHGLPGSYPSADDGSNNLIQLASPSCRPGQEQAPVPTLTASSVQNSANALIPNVTANYTPHPSQNLMNAPVQNFAPNYIAQLPPNRNQATLEHPRPPQPQQGLPATTPQAGLNFNNRPTHRARRDRFHYNRNETAAPQPHPPPQQRAAPYPVQHQPGDVNSQVERLSSELHLLTGKVHSLDRELPLISSITIP
ncbi:hypothetical protein H4Q26_002331 [Puccinia striiformis f. sp. tritici PST-130]|nr:hypothetical protein H4Q26_002331 [Puccinia striiformis f. sp. tritici PST-130]